MQSKATTVAQYLKSLTPERRQAIEAIRKVIKKNLPKGYEEGIQYGFIGYYVPHKVYQWGYHCDPTQPLPYAALASQKKHIGVYLMGIYGSKKEETWFRASWKKSGKKLDMGKSCVRAATLEGFDLKTIGEAIKRVPAERFIAGYEKALEGTTAGKKLAKLKATEAEGGGAPKKKAATKKAAKKAKKKTAKKKKAARR
jgi:hypothetical protein